MSRDDSSNPEVDDHKHDTVMPGFRFHPTEEELVEFYLRRKVEGKRFNVELITFLDLYRYDPWQLPALAAIGEREWFFYVPKDRKYRNGDRLNCVTTSGYWKATGADRMIRTEKSQLIGLKKTLVFYSGKAPKGIRTSWIMNEYRLPQQETECYQKVEISLCREYKKAGVENYPSLPHTFPSKTSLSEVALSSRQQEDTVHNSTENFHAFGGHSRQIEEENISKTVGRSSLDVTTALRLSKHNSYQAAVNTALGLPAPVEEGMLIRDSKQASPLVPTCATFFTGSSSVSSSVVDDLHRLVNYPQASSISQQQHLFNAQHQPNQFSTLPPNSQPLALNTMPTILPSGFTDQLWEWNPSPGTKREYTSPFQAI